MIQKLFFSLLGLLASLVGVWGVVRQGWTWQLAFPAAMTVAMFVAALSTGNRTTYEALLNDEDTAEDPAPPGAYEWGDAAKARPATAGPTSF